MSKLLDRLNTTPPDNSKANRAGKDKTPIDDQKFPFPGSKDYVKDEAKLKSPISFVKFCSFNSASFTSYESSI